MITAWSRWTSSLQHRAAAAAPYVAMLGLGLAAGVERFRRVDAEHSVTRVWTAQREGEPTHPHDTSRTRFVLIAAPNDCPTRLSLLDELGEVEATSPGRVDGLLVLRRGEHLDIAEWRNAQDVRFPFRALPAHEASQLLRALDRRRTPVLVTIGPGGHLSRVDDADEADVHALANAVVAAPEPSSARRTALSSTTVKQ